MPQDGVRPKNFYLNEQHELGRMDKEGAGRMPALAPVNWHARGTRISRSLRTAKQQIDRSSDPVKDSHYFLLAEPTESIEKLSKDKTKAPEGGVALVSEQADFSGTHSRVFDRLGMDLLRVTDEGSAIVHLRPEALDKLATASEHLAELGKREQARWVALDEFRTVPAELRLDEQWVGELPIDQAADTVIEFQPLLTILEIDKLIRVVSGWLKQASERVTGTGSDFSGRQWLRGRLIPTSIRAIADSFYSIQSLHSPLISFSMASGAGRPARESSGPALSSNIFSLPTIAIVDTGIPANHVVLAPYRRGAYAAPGVPFNSPKRHASFVASRAVFGDVDCNEGPPQTTPTGAARFFDVNIGGSGINAIEDKNVYPALRAVVSTAPDVRIFNLSFDTQPMDLMPPIVRDETLTLVQDLDNFIFENDILVVVSAGNSPPGILPQQPYPMHVDDPQWALGCWARSYNSLTCGAVVGKLTAQGLVKDSGWPSPFSRVGPGLCGSPKPDFVEDGGNATEAYQYAPGLGVCGLTDTGYWEDAIGTSFAAPILCGRLAEALVRLDSVCEKGARPFGVTVKAFLALTARPPAIASSIGPLADRALGLGYARAGRLGQPDPSSAVLIWQGVLESKDEIARVQIPIPDQWLEEAELPVFRLMVAWDPPVNAALRGLWATRAVHCQLREHPDAAAARTPNIRHASTYPLMERRYTLRKKSKEASDHWVLDISYDEIGGYNPAMVFSGQQRVAFAAELLDGGRKHVSPQAAIQALTVSSTMTRLTIPPAVVRTPVVVKALG